MKSLLHVSVAANGRITVWNDALDRRRFAAAGDATTDVILTAWQARQLHDAQRRAHVIEEAISNDRETDDARARRILRAIDMEDKVSEVDLEWLRDYSARTNVRNEEIRREHDFV